ncbi:MAG: hypothetical protein KDB90_14470 [Planctomycetes bacterium]|nr:hypothetical protein [Planctomycetota bacterium]
MTTADKSRHPELEHLTPAQMVALRELLVGRSITAAAAAAGVYRQTVSGWANTPGAFKTVMLELQHQPLAEATERLRHLAVDAAEALGDVMNDKGSPAGSRVTAAAHVLRACGAGVAEVHTEMAEDTGAQLREYLRAINLSMNLPADQDDTPAVYQPREVEALPAPDETPRDDAPEPAPDVPAPAGGMFDHPALLRALEDE